jgi:hypothetical protein
MSRQVDLILKLLRRMSVGSSGAQRPGTHAREKKRETAASSCSKTGWMPVQSGCTSLSEMSCWRTVILSKWPLDFQKVELYPRNGHKPADSTSVTSVTGDFALQIRRIVDIRIVADQCNAHVSKWILKRTKFHGSFFNFE